jgi:hypothetical protein
MQPPGNSCNWLPRLDSVLTYDDWTPALVYSAMSLLRTPSDYAKGNERIVRYVCEHTAVPYCVLDHHFFDGKSCGNTVARLSKPNPLDAASVALLKPHRHAYKGRQSYVQPTAAACRMFGVSEKRSEPLGFAALSQHTGINFFSEMGPYPRYRVTRREQVPLLGKATPRDNVPHVLVTPEEIGHYALLRVYQAVSDVRRSIRHLERLAEEISGHPIIGQLVATREYGLAVLATTPRNLPAMRSAIDEAKLDAEICVVCDLGPTAETLCEALHARREGGHVR